MLKIIFFIFSFFLQLFALTPNYIWISAKNSSAHIQLPQNIADKYFIKWDGDVSINNNFSVANGEGKLVFIRKTDNYESIPQKIFIDNGIITSNITINPKYKCLNKICSEKEIKGIFHLKFKNSNKEIIEPYIFQGDLKYNSNNKITGIGKLTTKSYIYEGELNNSIINGFGIFKSNNPDFQIYQAGEWKNNTFINGYMSTIYSDGGLYEGDSKNGIPDGKGIFIWKDGSKYNGNFKNGKRNGFGIYTFKDGSIYSGNYKNDIKNGYGELYIKPLDIYYKGNFKNGVFSGKGELYTKDFSYIGEFKNNMPDGKGIIIDNKTNKIIEVFAYKGTINPIYNTTNFSISNLFITSAYAWSVSGMWDEVKDTFKKVTNTVKKAYHWVKENKEHLVNAVKGCVAGGIGGAIAGGAGGAAAGGAIGAVGGSIVPGAGNAVGAAGGAATGAVIGAIAGGLNGCINQGIKAFKISKKNGGKYGLKEMKQALIEEISIENVAMGAAAAGFEAVLATAKVGQLLAKVPINKETIAISSRFALKSPTVKNVLKKACAIKYMKKFNICKTAKNYKVSKLSMVSWNLKNLSTVSKNSSKRDWNSIKEFITSKALLYDVIALQEIKDEQALQKITPYTHNKYIISENKQKEYFGFIVKKTAKTKLIDLKQYSKFIRPPSILILDKKFAIVNVHLFYGNNSIVDRIKRAKENFALVTILKDLKNKMKIKNIIVAGDFNIDFSKEDSNEKIDEMTNIFKNYLLANRFKIYIDKPTTIGKLSHNRFNKSYDHFIANTLCKTQVETDILANRKQNYFTKNVSDHLPISGICTFIEKTK